MAMLLLKYSADSLHPRPNYCYCHHRHHWLQQYMGNVKTYHSRFASSRNSSSGTITHCIPAAKAAFTPFGASSNTSTWDGSVGGSGNLEQEVLSKYTKQKQKTITHLFIVSRNASGNGLPRFIPSSSPQYTWQTTNARFSFKTQKFFSISSKDTKCSQEMLEWRRNSSRLTWIGIKSTHSLCFSAFWANARLQDPVQMAIGTP